MVKIPFRVGTEGLIDKGGVMLATGTVAKQSSSTMALVSISLDCQSSRVAQSINPQGHACRDQATWADLHVLCSTLHSMVFGVVEVALTTPFEA